MRRGRVSTTHCNKEEVAMKIMSVKHSFVAVSAAALVATALAPFSAVGDWTQNDGSSSTAGKKQDIVITLKSDPGDSAENLKAACLAVTLARSLRGDFSPDGARATKANVTLFPTLGGVTIGNESVVETLGDCKIPGPPGSPAVEISFQENLEDFLCDTGDRDDCPYADDLNMNNLVECPLCWSERYEYPPDYGVLNPAAVNKVLLNAEKVIDF